MYDIKNPRHQGKRASDLADRLVSDKEAMVELADALRGVLPAFAGGKHEVDEALAQVGECLDALAARRLADAKPGELIGGTTLLQPGGTIPERGASMVLIEGLCDKKECSISRPDRSKSNHTVRFVESIFDLYRRTADPSVDCWCGLNFCPFLCGQASRTTSNGDVVKSCDVKHVERGGALVRAIFATLLASANVQLVAFVTMTAAGKTGGGGLALEELRGVLPQELLDVLQPGFELTDKAKRVMKRISHPTTAQLNRSRPPGLVGAILSDTVAAVTGLRRTPTPCPELTAGVDFLKQEMGVTAPGVVASATAPPRPTMNQKAAEERRADAFNAIAAELGWSMERVQGLFTPPTPEGCVLAEAAGNQFVRDVLCMITPCLAECVVTSGVVVGHEGGCSTMVRLAFNSSRQVTGDLTAGSSSWAAALAFAAAATATPGPVVNAEGSGASAQLMARAGGPGSTATCVNLEMFNDRKGPIIAGSPSPSPDGRVDQPVSAQLLAVLGLNPEEKRPMHARLSKAVVVGLQAAMQRAGGGSQVVIRFGKRNGDLASAFAQFGGDSARARVVDLSPQVGALAQDVFGGNWGIGTEGGGRVSVVEREHGMDMVVVDQLTHPSNVQAASMDRQISGVTGGAINQHYAFPAAAAMMTVGFLRRPDSLLAKFRDYPFASLVDGRHGYLSGLCSLSGLTSGKSFTPRTPVCFVSLGALWCVVYRCCCHRCCCVFALVLRGDSVDDARCADGLFPDPVCRP